MKMIVLATLLIAGPAFAAEPASPQPAAKPAPEPAAAVQDLQPAVNTSAAAATPAPTTAPAPVGANAPGKGAVTRAKAPGAAPTGGARPAQDRVELDTTQITGNRELPKVLYIVPWKRSDLGDLTGRPVNSLLDEVLAPVDRDVFRRQNRYYDALHPDTSPNGSGAARQEGEK
jgi:hypothetical protein